MPIPIDTFEYATTSAAQAAWVAEGLLVSYEKSYGGTAAHEWYPDPGFVKLTNGALGTTSYSDPAWAGWLTQATFDVTVDLGVTKNIGYVRFHYLLQSSSGILDPTQVVIYGSLNNSDWDELDTFVAGTDWDNVNQNIHWSNNLYVTGSYRYIKYTFTNPNPNVVFVFLSEVQIYAADAFTISSESSIVKEGSYSMKVVASSAGSLNCTLTKTCSPTFNLSGQDYAKIWVRASRTGTNFKIGFHDSGGTTTESNIIINSADTWELKTIDISAIDDTNKDAIDSVIITVTNADAENTIYMDYLIADNKLLDKSSTVNRNSFMPFRGRNRELPTSLIIEKIGR